MGKENTKSALWEYIKTSLFFVVAGILSLYIVFEIFIPNQTVKVFGFKPYTVITQSMEPVINVNDIVVVKDYDIDELEVGDIITFKADINYDGKKEVVTHYIYSINTNNNGEYSIKTNRYYDSEDEVVPDTWLLLENDILGEYMFHIPLLGAIVLFLQSPYGIATIVVNIGVIIGIIYLIKQEKKEKNKEVNKNE